MNFDNNSSNPYRHAKNWPIPKIGGKCIILLPCLLFLAIVSYMRTIKPNDIFIIDNTISFLKNTDENPSSNKEGDIKLELLTEEEQDLWIQTNFVASDPSNQEWCVEALLNGTYWKRKNTKCAHCGAQFSQDIFLARNFFLQDLMTIHNNKQRLYIEAGANHYRTLSSTYFYDKCLGWDGLCIEPQKQYHDDIIKHRSCTLVKKCVMKEKQDMMLGGMPAHRGGGMFVEPVPEDNNITEGWDRIECASLQDILEEYSSNQKQVEESSSIIRSRIDLFVLDVEGAELIVLDAIEWNEITFDTLLIENNKMSKEVKKKLDEDMKDRGYPKKYQLNVDVVYHRHTTTIEGEKTSPPWVPKEDVVKLSN